MTDSRDEPEKGIGQGRPQTGDQARDAAVSQRSLRAKNTDRPDGRGQQEADDGSIDEERGVVHAARLAPCFVLPPMPRSATAFSDRA
ncbi:MAG: hypothetical protein O3A96_10940 [Proteobacteria bacterium]|nr:hypothetical protein [Pseudomonadota bacterium]